MQPAAPESGTDRRLRRSGDRTTVVPGALCASITASTSTVCPAARADSLTLAAGAWA